MLQKRNMDKEKEEVDYIISIKEKQEELQRRAMECISRNIELAEKLQYLLNRELEMVESMADTPEFSKELHRFMQIMKDYALILRNLGFTTQKLHITTEERIPIIKPSYDE